MNSTTGNVRLMLLLGLYPIDMQCLKSSFFCKTNVEEGGSFWSPKTVILVPPTRTPNFGPDNPDMRPGQPGHVARTARTPGPDGPDTWPGRPDDPDKWPGRPGHVAAQRTCGPDGPDMWPGFAAWTALRPWTRGPDRWPGRPWEFSWP